MLRRTRIIVCSAPPFGNISPSSENYQEQSTNQGGVLHSVSAWFQRREHNSTIKLHDKLIKHGHSCVHMNTNVFPAQLSYCGSFYGGCKFQTHIVKRAVNRIPYIILYSVLGYVMAGFLAFLAMFALVAWMFVYFSLGGDDYWYKDPEDYEPPVRYDVAEKEAKELVKVLVSLKHDHDSENVKHEKKVADAVEKLEDKQTVIAIREKEKENEEAQSLSSSKHTKDNNNSEEVKQVGMIEFASFIAKDIADHKKKEKEKEKNE